VYASLTLIVVLFPAPRLSPLRFSARVPPHLAKLFPRILSSVQMSCFRHPLHFPAFHDCGRPAFGLVPPCPPPCIFLPLRDVSGECSLLCTFGFCGQRRPPRHGFASSRLWRFSLLPLLHEMHVYSPPFPFSSFHCQGQGTSSLNPFLAPVHFSKRLNDVDSPILPPIFVFPLRSLRTFTSIALGTSKRPPHLGDVEVFWLPAEPSVS